MNRYLLVAVTALIVAPAAGAQTLPVPNVRFRLSVPRPAIGVQPSLRKRDTAAATVDLPMPVVVRAIPEAGRMPVVRPDSAPFASLTYRDRWTNPLFRGTPR